MKLSAYHYAVALRGAVAGTRYTLPMSWPVATDYLISLEACTLSPDPPDAAALEPFLMLMVIHPHQVPDALFMFLGPVGWQLRLYPPEQTSDGVETVHDLDSLADALGLVAVTILSSKSLLAEAKRQGFCPPRGYNRRRGDRA